MTLSRDVSWVCATFSAVECKRWACDGPRGRRQRCCGRGQRHYPKHPCTGGFRCRYVRTAGLGSSSYSNDALSDSYQ